MGLLRRCIRRLHLSYMALPSDVRRRWWVWMMIGAVGVQLLVVVLVAIGRWAEGAGLLDWETTAVAAMESLPISFSFGMWLEGIGNGFVLWIVMLYAAGFAALRGEPLAALSILVGYTGVYFHVATGWILWTRPRPDLIAQGVGSPGGIFSAYPSGHLIQTIFAYGILIYFWYRRSRSRWERVAAVGVLLAAASAVTLGRLRTGAHWPSDMVAGALIGGAWLAAVLFALTRGNDGRAASYDHEGTGVRLRSTGGRKPS